MTTRDIPERPWLTPGAKVAIVGRGTLNVTTVKSVGKRYAVTENGTRYDLTQRGDLHSSTASVWDHGSTLLPLDHPEVRAVRRDLRIKRLISEGTDIRAGVHSAEQIREAAAKLAEAADLMAEREALAKG